MTNGNEYTKIRRVKRNDVNPVYFPKFHGKP